MLVEKRKKNLQALNKITYMMHHISKCLQAHNTNYVATNTYNKLVTVMRPVISFIQTDNS